MTKPSNLLIIMSDEHQARALSCAGHPCVKTPNLDRLAERGVRFSNAYTPSPICVPARASFASGRYVHDIRLWDNAMPYTGKPRGWGHALQDKSVRVESIGKLHYRHHEDPAGFDEEHIPMQVAGGTGMVWASIRDEENRVCKNVRMLGEYIGPGESPYTKYDTEVVERTKKWISESSQSADKPWCLYVGLVAPHFPLIVPQEYFDLYPLDSLPKTKLHPRDGYLHHPWVAKQDAVLVNEKGFRDEEERLTAIASYYALCTWMDNNVGQILQALDEEGFSENTTVIYTSDHGDNVGVRGLWGKSNMYEESVAVPLILAPPKLDSFFPKGAVCANPVSLLDVSETIIDHFNAELEGERPGKSLYEIATSSEDSDRVIFSEYHAVGAVSGCYMIRKGPWKYIYYLGYYPELFNLDEDPEETTNRAEDPMCSEIIKYLHSELIAICDPVETNKKAFSDQAEMIENYGGREKALRIGAPAATPPPKI